MIKISVAFLSAKHKIKTYLKSRELLFWRVFVIIIIMYLNNGTKGLISS